MAATVPPRNQTLDAPEGQAPPRLMLTLGSLMVVITLAALDSNIVNTALPRISASLAELDHLSWIVTAFMLGSTVTMPLYGKLSDIHGRRPMFTVAILIFLVGSTLCSLAQTMGQLILFRAVQGVGAGGLVPLVMTTVGDILPPRERGKFQGLFTAVFGVSAIGGPVLGGLLTDAFGWRSIFYLNVPIGLLALMLLRSTLPRSPRRAHAIDYRGALLVVASAIPLLLGLSWGGRTVPWLSLPMLALVLVTVSAATMLYRHEHRVPEPVIAVDLLPNDVYRTSVLVLSFVGMGFFGAMVFVPLFLQQVKGLSPAQSGLMILPLMIGNILSAALGGRFVSRSGRYKFVLVTGMALVTVGLLVLSAMIWSNAGLWPIGLSLFVAGVGGGLGMPQVTVAAQNVMGRRDMGAATSTLQFFNSLAGSAGVALAGAIMTAGLLSHGLPAPSQDAANATAYAAAIGQTCLVNALICGVAFLISMTIPDLELRSE